jgi:hypothetical protein
MISRINRRPAGQQRYVNSPATGGKHKAKQGRDENPDQHEMTLMPPALVPPTAGHPSDEEVSS